MKRMHRVGAGPLIAIIFTMLIAAVPASANGPLALTDIYVTGDFPGFQTLQDGDAIDRGAGELRLRFNHILDDTSLEGTVSVRDSQGRDPGWRFYHWGMTLNTPGGLPAGEQYTIRVKGGPQGIRDTNGGTLPADLSITLRTTELAPLQMTSMYAIGGPGSGEIADGGIIPRNASELRIDFSRDLDPATIPGAVTVTDSQGRDPGWGGNGSGGRTIYFYIKEQLPKGETYTIRIKGGRGGVKSIGGITLPADITRTLRTDDQAYQRQFSTTTAWWDHGVVQAEVYQIKAGPGPLKVHLNNWPKGGWAWVHLKDDQTKTSLMDRVFFMYGETFATVNLPREGTYRLLVAPNEMGTISVEGPDLEMAREMPVVQLPKMALWEVRNERFDATPELVKPGDTGALRISLNEKVLHENALRPDGTVAPVSIDPNALGDGLYRLSAIARGRSSGNEGWSVRLFLVDREDSFRDVSPVHWARSYVEAMRHLGIINGRTGGRFAPGDPVTRAEFAKMIAATLGLRPANQSPAPFADMRDDWSKPYIQALWEKGLMVGEKAGSRAYFYPDRQITRAEAATILGRALEIAAIDISREAAPFPDFDQVPSWARPSVLILSYAKWLNGFPDGKFHPGERMNRDQAAKILSNFIGMK